MEKTGNISRVDRSEINAQNAGSVVVICFTKYLFVISRLSEESQWNDIIETRVWSCQMHTGHRGLHVAARCGKLALNCLVFDQTLFVYLQHIQTHCNVSASGLSTRSIATDLSHTQTIWSDVSLSLSLRVETGSSLIPASPGSCCCSIVMHCKHEYTEWWQYIHCTMYLVSVSQTSRRSTVHVHVRHSLVASPIVIIRRA